jgi:death-on-curing protein
VSEPRFISVEQVQEIHRRQIKRYGGTEGLRDVGALESAVFQPQNDYFYANADVFDIAAAYAFHIAQAQAFLDGNKRTAVGTALVFLESNGVATRTATLQIHEAMIAIAERRSGKRELAALFRELFAPAT